MTAHCPSGSFPSIGETPEIIAKKDQPLFSPPSPGEVLRRYIVEGRRITQDELASAMGVSRLTVNQLINGKRNVTAETALRLARVLRTTPEFWLDLQRGVDLHAAKEALADQLATMPVLRKSVAAGSTSEDDSFAESTRH